MARYFTEEEFKGELDLNKIDVTLKKLYKSEDILPTQELSIEFFMMSNDMDKLEMMEEFLEDLGMEIDSVEQHEDGCELIAITEPMKMDAETVKKWFVSLWNEGYKLDCKLDGWHVLID